MSAESAASDEVARFRAGDGVAFRSIVARYSPYLAAVARSFAADGDDLQDLVQQAWARIYERRGDFAGAQAERNRTRVRRPRTRSIPEAIAGSGPAKRRGRSSSG